MKFMEGGPTWAPRIELPRPTAAEFERGDHSEIETLVTGAKDLVEETCLLAHEFGHYGSPYAQYEEVMERRSKGRELITREEADAIREEERRAWDEAERVLRELGFTEWHRFREVSQRNLKSYDEV